MAGKLAQAEAISQRKTAATIGITHLGSWAMIKVDPIPIGPTTPPDDPDYESSQAVSEGSEPAPQHRPRI